VWLPAVIVHAVEQRLAQVGMLQRLLMLPHVALVHSGHDGRHRADKITVQIDEDDDGENVHILLLDRRGNSRRYHISAEFRRHPLLPVASVRGAFATVMRV
jgi:hypothetical protein